MLLHKLNTCIILYAYIILCQWKSALLSYILKKIDHFGSNLSTYPYPRGNNSRLPAFNGNTNPTHRPTLPWTEYNSPHIYNVPGFVFTKLYSVSTSVTCLYGSHYGHVLMYFFSFFKIISYFSTLYLEYSKIPSWKIKILGHRCNTYGIRNVKYANTYHSYLTFRLIQWSRFGFTFLSHSLMYESIKKMLPLERKIVQQKWFCLSTCVSSMFRKWRRRRRNCSFTTF